MANITPKPTNCNYPRNDRNIIIFGGIAAGKSSLINMLSGGDMTMVSDDVRGCTPESAPNPITIGDTQYILWDTVGLNEGENGTVPIGEALYSLRDLVHKLKDGVNLLVYCLRAARYRDIMKANYDMFVHAICEGQVPVVIVVTGLENEGRMEDWWDANGRKYEEHGMMFAGYACITTTKGKNNVFLEEYEESKKIVQDVISKYCPEKAWATSPDVWFGQTSDRIKDGSLIHEHLL
ncbi:hypothetical protein P691DRAFT_799195 [Macrolepiota fuliginosa MF-IS2]|uniref:G domain-containing protein n=1 Tax=Macrolepiota fuliginosa MF-IS2 TaxID=1400762 RepID=A0A9P5WZ15_9AGAR|nr:hypothetical protein P691DRAFT_799195 [Macrolepiota fuliginosa MF-IS2]